MQVHSCFSLSAVMRWGDAAEFCLAISLGVGGRDGMGPVRGRTQEQLFVCVCASVSLCVWCVCAHVSVFLSAASVCCVVYTRM